MFFTVQNIHKFDPHRYGLYIKEVAYRIILCYPMRAEELVLDNFLKQHLHFGLKEGCLKILAKCKILEAKPGIVTVIINDRNADRLARLITYGTDEIYGSRILKEAFNIAPL